MKKMCGFLWFKLVSLPTSLTILVIFIENIESRVLALCFLFMVQKLNLEENSSISFDSLNRLWGEHYIILSLKFLLAMMALGTSL